MFPLYLDVFMTIWILLLTCLFIPLCGTAMWRPSLCPKGCHCDLMSHTHISSTATSLKTVDCTNSHLSKVPFNISFDTQAILLARNSIKPEDISNFPGIKGLVLLDLSSNHFYTLEDSRLVAPSLTHLLLEHDELDYLSNRIFTGVLQLQYLSIAHNKIEIIHSNTFDGLHQLLHLSLSHNRIFAVNPNWFQDLQALQKLDLTGNNIHVLWNQGLRFLTGLKTLVLTDNRLNHIYEEAFMGLLELKELFLDNNHLKEIPSSAFQYFPALDAVDLSGNHFKQLPTGSFVSVNVTRLRLSNIKELEFIDRHAFVSLPFLRVLDLTNNKALMFIHPDSFHDVTSLEQMFLQNSSLLTLESGIALSLPGLRLINVKGNKEIACDCTWTWIDAAAELEFGNNPYGDGLNNDNTTTTTSSSNNYNKTIPDNHSSLLPIVLSNGTNITSPTFLNSFNTTSSSSQINLSVVGKESAYCKFPKDLNGVKLSSFVISDNISSTCTPRLVPLLPVEYSTVLGEDVVFSCRGFGQPSPRVYWVSLEAEEKQDSNPGVPLIRTKQSGSHVSESFTLPHASDSNSNQSHGDRIISSTVIEMGKNVKIISTNLTSRVRADLSGTLRLDYVQGSDSGLYKCVVENSAGTAEHVIKLHVRTVLADVIIVHVSSSSITVTWKSAIYDHDFQLFYKPKESNDTYKIVDLRPYMRTYTGNVFLVTIIHSLKSPMKCS